MAETNKDANQKPETKKKTFKEMKMEFKMKHPKLVKGLEVAGGVVIGVATLAAGFAAGKSVYGGGNKYIELPKRSDTLPDFEHADEIEVEAKEVEF